MIAVRLLSIGLASCYAACDMATKCEICGKGTTFGRNIRHQHSGRWQRKAPRTNRVFRANVQEKTLTINGQTRRFHICTRCLRTQVKIR